MIKSLFNRLLHYFRRNSYEKVLDKIIRRIVEKCVGITKPGAKIESTIRPSLNLISVDISENKSWNGKVAELAAEIVKRLTKILEESRISMFDRTVLNNLSIHIKYGEESEFNENYQVFYGTPTLGKTVKRKKLNWISKLITSIWFWPTLITIIVTTVLVLASINHFYEASTLELAKIDEINQNITFVTGIFGSFIMTFLMTRVLNLRQEKLKRAPQIKALSEKLAQFQKICFHLVNDDRFWLYSEDYKYAKRISNRISYWDSKSLAGHEDDVKFNYFRSLIDEQKHRTSIIWLYLQLNMFADLNPMQNLNLLYTKHPPVKIYSLKEIDDF